MLRLIQKKGQSHWLSWILLSALTLIVTVFMYRWMTGYAEDTSTEIIKTFENTEECDNVAMDMQACQSATKSVLYINVTNRGYLTINGFLFHLYDAHDNVVNRAQNETIRPNYQKKLTIVRQGIVEHLEAIPVIIKEESEIICSKKTVTVENVGMC
ncbi:hypothetical protein COV93_06265 [Candidatus Woesearchaeota archaeon CG11_big_fil_rev_8_21_14_0_20_43_8]|nr:MAG: hypothetical protein COV93_06265 [Candidatus Woesearchaeota archaeon CG11_big_fil_rev_8_21_14_0_20_43_8]PIO08515.1 MAG: hypothetical protein COT47_01235 [Candidatus Woesearchaeota archaeon CG08_land_8_20_14_0_20_43_7]